MTDFAPTALIGTITRINSPYEGWYTASVAPFADYEVFGTPLRISSFAVGEKVQVFQCFFYNNTVEYGFAKLAEYDYGAVQIPPPMYDQFLERYRYGMTLAWLCNKANKTEMMFSPGIVEGFITSGGIRVGLRVRLRFTGELRPLGVTPDIADLDDFEIGDGVLVSHWPNPGRAVIGWWQTVKGLDEGFNFNAGRITITLQAPPFDIILSYGSGSVFSTRFSAAMKDSGDAGIVKSTSNLYSDTGVLIGSVFDFQDDTSAEYYDYNLVVGNEYIFEIVLDYTGETQIYNAFFRRSGDPDIDLTDRVTKDGNTLSVPFKVAGV